MVQYIATICLLGTAVVRFVQGIAPCEIMKQKSNGYNFDQFPILTVILVPITKIR